MTRRRKLSDNDIAELRRERAEGALIRALSDKYGISYGHVSKVVTGMLYPHHGGAITKAINLDHCRRGHTYTEENSYFRIRSDRRGYRQRVCRVCMKQGRKERDNDKPDL